MPLLIFVAFAVVCQAAIVGISLAVDRFVASWVSVMTFGVLYIVAFMVAWKLTVWFVEKYVPRLTKGAPS
jgi:hypothetical protein